MNVLPELKSTEDSGILVLTGEGHRVGAEGPGTYILAH